MMFIPEHVAVRAASRYVQEDECWISTYSVGSHGYAQLGWKGADGVYVGTTAHRAAWVFWNDRQIGEGLTIDHECKNRRCVNPLHLRELPNLENARRTSGRDWPLGQCVRGHDNSRWKPKGEHRKRGYCANCRADDQRAYRERKKA